MLQENEVVKKALEKEKLYITEFSADFFDKLIKKGNDKEDGKINSDEIKDVIEKVKEKSPKGKNEFKIWTAIFEVLMKEKYVEDLFEPYQPVSETGEILNTFYYNKYFLYFETAQLIKYNLERLEGIIECDLMEDMEPLIKYTEVGRKDYSKLGKNKEESIQIFEDKIGELPIDLKALESRYKDASEKVCLIKEWNEEKIYLDSFFKEVNYVYIANGRFKNFLYRRGNAITLKEIEEMISKLENDISNDNVYLWEKLTNFNVIILMAEFFGKNYNSFSKKEMKRVLEQYSNIIHNIEAMPNILTRILFLKVAFDHISMDPNGLVEKITKLNEYIGFSNIKYGNMINDLTKYAVIIRWNYGDKNAYNAERWREELEREFSIELFRQWRKSVNIRNAMVHCSTENPNESIIVALETEILTRKVKIVNKNFMSNLCIFLNSKSKAEVYIKMLVLSYIAKYNDDEKKIIKQMLKDKWSVIAIKTEKIESNVIGEICTEVDENMNLSITIQRPDQEDIAIRKAKKHETKEENKISYKIIDIECAKRYLKKEIEMWEISSQKHIMIEKIPEGKREKFCLELLMKI